MPDEEATVVGRVAEVWRYPVKSMQGERVAATTVADRGVFGDRAFALQDVATGKVASAKSPRLSAEPARLLRDLRRATET